jgi:serine protease Do
MKFILRASCFLVVIVAMVLAVQWKTSANDPKPLEAVSVYEQGGAAVAYIRVLGEYNNVRSVGSGVIISGSGEMLTAYHVIKNATSYEVVLPDGRTITDVKLVASNESKDIALMQLPAPKKDKAYSYVTLRKDVLKHGEKVYAIGYPLKETAIITEGIVNTPAADINNRSRILTSAQIVSGMSGGALLDQKGQLSGIISGSLRSMDGIHLIINMEDILDLYGEKK